MSGGRAPDALLESDPADLRRTADVPPTLEVDRTGRSGAPAAVVEWGIHLKGEAGIQMHVSFAEGAWIVDERGAPSVAGEGYARAGLETARCPQTQATAGLVDQEACDSRTQPHRFSPVQAPMPGCR